MTETPFKVGETYKTRDGRDAVLIVCDFDLDDPLIFKVKTDEGWLVADRQKDGRFIPGRQDVKDILPPRRGVWVAVDVETGEPREYCDAFRDRPSTQLGDECEWRFFVEAEPQP